MNFLSDYLPEYNEYAVVHDALPVRITFNIEGKTELLKKVVVSKNACIEIPELEVRILPGSKSEDLYCDVYELLSRIETAVKADTIEEVKKEEVLLKMALLKNGRFRATLVLIDPRGLSFIMGAAQRECINT